MADYELIGLNEAAPDLRAPTSADRGVIVGGVLVEGLAELDGGADINGSRVTTVADTNPLSQAVRVAMTVATSGSAGITVLANAAWAFGNGAFSLVTKIRPSGFASSSRTRHSSFFNSTGTSASNPILNFDLSGGNVTPKLFINSVEYAATATLTQAEFFAGNEWAVIVTPPSTLGAGLIVFYRNGLPFGASVTIAAGAPHTFTGSNLIIEGQVTIREPGDLYQVIIYNRALSAAEVLSLCVNGPALADIGASQTPIYTSDFSAGVDGATGFRLTIAGNIDAIGGEDNWLRGYAEASSNSKLYALSGYTGLVAGTKYRLSFKYYIPSVNTNTKRLQLISQAAGESTNTALALASFEVTDSATSVTVEFTAGTSGQYSLRQATSTGVVTFTGANSVTDDLTYIKDVVVTQIGITGQWNAQDAQSNTGQIFDSSGNKNHALLPAAGATIIGKESAQLRQVRWTNTWDGTNELQYIGGVNQAILPANAYIESIIGTVTGATVEDIIIGDGSDADRYVTITTGLAAGTTSFTLANRTTDGTNLKLTVDPDTNADMSIAWVITYRTLE